MITAKAKTLTFILLIEISFDNKNYEFPINCIDKFYRHTHYL